MDITELFQYYTELSDNILFVKLLVFLLLFTMIYYALQNVPRFNENRAMLIIVSLIVSLISTIQIKEETINNYILIPYSTLSTIILFGIPFFLILISIHKTNMSGAGRKITWAIYLLLVVWGGYNSINESNELNNAFIIIGVITLIMILADNQINTLIRKIRK